MRRSFITPFDRGDIKDLIGSMDDSIDQMQKTAKAITLFEQKLRTADAPDGRRHRRCAELTEDAAARQHRRDNPARINTIAEEVTRLEEQADELNDQGIKALFKHMEQRRDGLHHGQ